MKIFEKATTPCVPKSHESKNAAYLYAAILIIFILGQLFTFDEFLTLFTRFGVIGGPFVAKLMGSLIVIFEVFALPFLLGMRLNQFTRITSMIFGWLVPLGWLKVTLWLNLTNNAVPNVGFVGTKIQLIPGWWSVSFVIALCMLAAWASWGLWPIKNNKGVK